jgi:transketolase
MLSHHGFVYMRTLRPKTPVLYDIAEEFQIGGSKILRQSKFDALTIAATGITVFEAMKAADELREQGIHVRVIDCYSINPIDRKTLIQCLQETRKQIIVTVEDHFSHGGMGDFAVAAISDKSVRVDKMAVAQISESGTKEQLLNKAGIDASSIIARVKLLIK